MNNDKELMQQALDALKRAISDDKSYIAECKASAEALSARLTYPELEPHGYLWFTRYMEQRFTHRKPDELERIGNITPLYTAQTQREWQWLTDEEIDEAHETTLSMYGFSRVIEAKLKEKNNG